MKEYSIQQLASLAGVSVCTLHYYDEIGLLLPDHVKSNGYRYYGEKQLLLLQQILFFKELEFPLDEIKRIVKSPHFDMETALQEQKKMLVLKSKRVKNLIQTINKTLHSMKHPDLDRDQNSGSGIPKKHEELYDAFKDDDVKQYQDEVKQRWGDTDAYKQSMARVGKMTKAQMQQLKDDGKKFTQKLADAMDKDIKSKEVQDLIAEHYKGIQFFYDCPLEMYRNLGQMYVDDPRFTAYYDKFRPGLAVFVRNAIQHFCSVSENK